MFQSDEMNFNKTSEGLCCHSDHYFKSTHICIQKECKYERIFCIKCEEEQLHHQLPEEHLFLSIDDFANYIEELIEQQSKQYRSNELQINQLKKIQPPSGLTIECLSLLQKAQDKHLQTFSLAEYRFDDDKRKLDKGVLKQMIEINDNSIDEYYFQINEIFSQIKEGGMQMDIDNQHKYDQYVLEQNYQQEYFQNQFQAQFYRKKHIIRASISPNGKYLACSDHRQIKIYELKYNKKIINKKITDFLQVYFSDDSRFYFYYENGNLYYQALGSKKIIFKFQTIRKWDDIIISQINSNEIIISDLNITIIDIQNRSTQKFDHTTNQVIYGLDYDKSNNIIVCVKQQNLQFFDKNSKSLIFEKQPYKQLISVKFVPNTNYLIISSNLTLILCLLSYDQKQLYYIKQFIGYEIFNKIQDQSLILTLNNSGIVILDLDFNEIQNIQFQYQQDLIHTNQDSSKSHFIVCTFDQIYIYRQKQIS